MPLGGYRGAGSLVITWITTHLQNLERWKAKLA